MDTIEAMMILKAIQADPRYQTNILYGSPRRGHAEGAVAAHIAELELNLDYLDEHYSLDEGYFAKLRLLIHVHDSFKAETAAKGKKNIAIEDPDSHASLARAYLAELCQDEDLLNMVQYHDLGYAIYRNYKDKGYINEARLQAGLDKIKDKNLFLLFCICDSCTASKGREMIRWFVEEVNKRVPGLWVGVQHIIPGEVKVGEAW